MDSSDVADWIGLLTPDGQEKWRTVGPFTREKLAGMVVAGTTLLKFSEGRAVPHHTFIAQIASRQKVSQFFDVADVSLDYRQQIKPFTDRSQLAIHNFLAETVETYFFDSVEFVSGAIAMLEAFNANVMDYLLPPTQADGQIINLPGYNFSGFNNPLDQHEEFIVVKTHQDDIPSTMVDLMINSPGGDIGVPLIDTDQELTDEQLARYDQQVRLAIGQLLRDEDDDVDEERFDNEGDPDSRFFDADEDPQDGATQSPF